ncbi:hypothetical protein [Brachybacterium sp. UNK5269]|uniref:hypothetical protein n=1 Tax=Brachybacterium sp. UNK5269 TaxID=3408576 RepID=UPI003BAE62C4
MTLIHPRSLERWQEWRRAVGSPRTAGGRPDASGPAELVLHTRAGEGTGRILIGMDTDSAAAREALLSALPYLHASVMVLAPTGLELPELSGAEWSQQPVLRAREVLADGGFTAMVTLGWEQQIGHLVHTWAQRADVPGVVVQHTALTPFTAPLPPRTTLLAWSAADAEFHRSQRDDVAVRTVGSQRLWQAVHEATETVLDLEERPVFLGELTAPELPRRHTFAAAYSYCRSARALYQPHVTETDRLSRAAHEVLRRRGVDLQDAGRPVSAQHRPVVSVLSLDVLEAALRGLPSWVHGSRLPTWVPAYWERYGMRRTGGPATPAPTIAADEPARLIAQFLEGGA